MIKRLRYTILIVVFVVSTMIPGTAQYISLPEKPLSVQQDGFYINAVLDLRRSKNRIGVLQKEITAKPYNINFTDHFSDYLENYFKRNYSSTGEKLTLIIHDFWVWEEIAAARQSINYYKSKSEKGHVDGRMSVCRTDSAGNLRVIYTFFDHLESEAVDITPKHPKQIRDFFSLCFSNLIKSKWRNNPGYLFEEGKYPKVDVTAFKEQQVFPAGVYQSVAELINKEPSIAWNELKISKDIHDNIRIKNLDKILEQPYVYAYSDGKRLYASSRLYNSPRGNGYFSPVVETGRFLLIEDEIIRRTPDRGAVIPVGYSEGILSEVDMNYSPLVLANDTDGFILDLETGRSYVYNHKGIMNILEEFPEVRDRYLSQDGENLKNVWRSCIVHLNRMDHSN